MVHEELWRLSERERLPLMLCEMEGMSHADAAKAAGWRACGSSIWATQPRPREAARRLARRGLTPVWFAASGFDCSRQLISNAPL